MSINYDGSNSDDSVYITGFEEAKKLTSVALDLIIQQAIDGQQIYGWLFINYLLREKELILKSKGLIE